ncbi:MAG: DNA recombination protein RmuC [Firmicutes bacterium]|nr:DNA recombination protein RmuC [Bacillota bacterium]
MEYIIISLLIIILVFLIVLVTRKNNNSDLTERLGHFEANINKEIGDFKLYFTKELQQDFENLSEKVDRKLTYINDSVNERLDKNFEKSNKTFMEIATRISKIDEAQKKIEALNSEIVSLQSVLTDKKTRGTFGEVNLEYILNNAFGSSNNGVYVTQYKFKNGYIVDALLYAPLPLGTIAIDAKFPLENYQKMTDRNKSKEERLIAEKLFVNDVKKHITDISQKYIVPGETSNEAIMFLPAEAIFAEINAYHPEILNFAYQKKVWITGPTTLISTLSIISMVLKNMERDKYAQVIHDELGKLSLEFSRFKERWDKLSRSVKTVNQSIDELHITSSKIEKRFASINSVELDKLEEKV